MAIPEAKPVAPRVLPRPPVTLEGVRETLLRLPHLEQLDGFGVFGSLGGQSARRFYPEYSDIDVFIVLKEEFWPTDYDRWVRAIMDALGDRFNRDVDVMVYSLRGLRKVPTWYEISLASDCPVLYDPEGKVGYVFRRIVEAARAADLAQEWIGDQLLWRKQHLVIGERIVVEVPDDGE